MLALKRTRSKDRCHQPNLEHFRLQRFTFLCMVTKPLDSSAIFDTGYGYLKNKLYSYFSVAVPGLSDSTFQEDFLQRFIYLRGRKKVARLNNVDLLTPPLTLARLAE